MNSFRSLQTDALAWTRRSRSIDHPQRSQLERPKLSIPGVCWTRRPSLRRNMQWGSLARWQRPIECLRLCRFFHWALGFSNRRRHAPNCTCGSSGRHTRPGQQRPPANQRESLVAHQEVCIGRSCILKRILIDYTSVAWQGSLNGISSPGWVWS